MASVKFSLIENAHHSLERSIRHAHDAVGDPREWKFAILLLVQAIELVCKARLFREHPVLIFADVDRRQKTVTIGGAIKRLQEIAGLRFSERDAATLRTAVDWRNRLMHHEWEVGVDEAKRAFFKLVSWLKEFYDEHFDSSLEAAIGEEMWQSILFIDEFVEDARVRAAAKIEANDLPDDFIWACRRCDQDAFVIEDGQDICYLCGYVDETNLCEDCGEICYADEMLDVAAPRESWHIVCEKCARAIEDAQAEDEYLYRMMVGEHG